MAVVAALKAFHLAPVEERTDDDVDALVLRDRDVAREMAAQAFRLEMELSGTTVFHGIHFITNWHESH